MSLNDIFINLILAIVLIVGAYQFYFLPQKHSRKKAKEITPILEDKIPFKAGWVWVYSGLYYPVILLLVFTVESFEQFNYIAFSFMVLLFIQVFIFYIFPVATPDKWRNYDKNASKSHKFLSMVHNFDDTSNCFPSMHVSVATLTSLHLFERFFVHYPLISFCSFLFPVLISLSTLYTKQHYLIDIPAGAILGYLCYLLLNL